MRRVIGLLVLLAGCASPNGYYASAPATVCEPVYAGPGASRVPPPGGAAYAPPGTAPQPPYEPVMPPRTNVVDWLRSGRGWTWGAASRGPIRDEGLDRLMVDTLTSSSPQPSQEPLPPVRVGTCPGDSWVYPAAPH